MEKSKLFWSKLCLANLAIVALLGFTLRSKILFPVPFIDYRSFLSAHSHFAFAGWAGMALTTLLIYNLLPGQLSSNRFYQWILGAIEICSLGMAISFPLQGYGFWSILFSSGYIVVNYVFAVRFLGDITKTNSDKTIKLFTVGAIISLLVSAIGPLGLVYILVNRSGDSILYRDSIYTFLHFQYNGFFTLAVFALFYRFLINKGMALNRKMKTFAVILVTSVVPALFLSLLWHNSRLYYALGIAGCILLLSSLYYFVAAFYRAKAGNIYSTKLAAILLIFSLASFGIKTFLNAGTVIPSLGNAVYGDRPVIIGFLHLVFLAFVSFFILGQFAEEGLFHKQGRLIKMPLIVFAIGVFLNEILLAIQGLGILFMTNSQIYSWLLWIAAIVLLVGSVMIAATVANKKASA